MIKNMAFFFSKNLKGWTVKPEICHFSFRYSISRDITWTPWSLACEERALSSGYHALYFILDFTFTCVNMCLKPILASTRATSMNPTGDILSSWPCSKDFNLIEIESLLPFVSLVGGKLTKMWSNKRSKKGTIRLFSIIFNVLHKKKTLFCIALIFVESQVCSFNVALLMRFCHWCCCCRILTVRGWQEARANVDGRSINVRSTSRMSSLWKHFWEASMLCNGQAITEWKGKCGPGVKEKGMLMDFCFLMTSLI